MLTPLPINDVMICFCQNKYRLKCWYISDFSMLTELSIATFIIKYFYFLLLLYKTSNLPRALHVGQMNVIKNDVVVILLFAKNMVGLDI